MIGERVLNYQIESLIGEGGVGAVYLATHTQLGRKVAIKILRPELVNHPEIRERFRNEATTLSSLQHINIITLYDYTEDDRGLFLIMEYATGSSLDEYIRKTSGPIPEQKAIYFFNQILDGFAYAHQKSIVHRDIKPSNIIITSEADVKILDFGIAKILKEGKMSMTKTGAKLGTVLYMSPEQVKGQLVDNRTDIYSLGVTLFQMLTGRCPYDENTMTEYDIFNKIVQEPLPLAKSFYPAVSERMQAIIDKATAKDPMRRFQSCEEFRAALNQQDFSFTSTQVFVQNPVVQSEKITTNPSTSQETHTPKISKNYIPEKRERNNTLLYVLLSLLFFTTVGFFIYQFSQMNRKTEDTTLLDKDENENKDLDKQNIDNTDTEEIKEEKSAEDLLLDSLEVSKTKLEEFIKILKKDRDDELLKGLVVDGQFESDELGEFVIQITVTNQRTDAKFKNIVITTNYFNNDGNVIKTKEQELEPLNEGQSFSYKSRESVNAAKFTCKLKSAETVDLEVPQTLDSLNKEMEKMKEKIADLKKIKMDEE